MTLKIRIVKGMDAIRVDEAVRLLRATYWAGGRSAAQIEASMRHSDCYGVYPEDGDRLVGFARVITDQATTWYLCDVVIDPEYRHQGLGKALVGYIAARDEYARLRGFLFTRDAHGLYERFGFETADGTAMVRPPRR